jgi:SAM-dependent methyltransferase
MKARFDQAYSYSLPYEPNSFDRILSTLFFHHLDPDAKRRTLAEALRVLKPAGEIHVADWGLPSSPLSRLLFLPVRMVDGFDNTRDNVTGNLVALFAEAGFRDVAIRGGMETMFGTLSFYFARKPF